jgi:hypothetical protein
MGMAVKDLNIEDARFAARPVVVFLNLNLSCAQPGERHFRNLTTFRSHLMLAEENRVALKRSFLAAGRRMRSIQDLNLL